MTIITVQFDYLGMDRYKTLMDVFRYSLRKNFPDAVLQEINLTPNPHWHRETIKRGFHSNKIKLDAWADAMEKIKDDKIIFMDCDMLVLKPLDKAFKYDFDIGITYRTRVRMPYNGGVIFVRNSKKTQDFVRLWAEIDEKMYKDKKFHNPWRHKYAGINQASFGYLLENPQLHGIKFKEFPCSIWNVCCENRYNDNMKCIHIKSQVRKLCFSRYPTEAIEFEYRGQVEIWRKYAIEAGVYNKKKERTDIQELLRKKRRMKTRPKRKVLR